MTRAVEKKRMIDAGLERIILPGLDQPTRVQLIVGPPWGV